MDTMHITTSDGARIGYDVSGRGPAIVFLHCTAASRGQWSELRRAYEARWTTVAIDLHGHGDSHPWHGRRGLRLADEAAAVAAVLARLDGPAHVVGHSYGGAVALNLALSGVPLASLTLVEPVAFHLLRDGAAATASLVAEVATIAGAVADGVRSGDHAAAMATFVDYWSGAGTWAAMREDRRPAVARMAPAVALHFGAAMGDAARLADCARLDVPTLVLAGDRTRAPAAAIASRLAGAIPGCHARIVAGAGHMLPRTHPDPFLRALGAHLERVIAGAEEARLPAVA